MNKSLSIVAAAVITTGCTVNVHRPAEAVPAQAVYRSPSPKPAPKPTKSVSTLKQAADLCRKIQASDKLQMACDMDFVKEDTPVLTVVVPSLAYWNSVKDTFTDGVAVPFCLETVAHWPKSAMILAVMDDDRMAVFGCKSTEWSGWTSIKSDEASYM